MPATEAILTPSEVEIINLSKDDPNIYTDYFFRQYGGEQGWRYDYNFVPEGAWQLRVDLAAQRDITVIGGFATGKTVGMGVSACKWAGTTRDFRFLNIAPTLWQSEMMYRAILELSRNTRFEQLIWKKPSRPHPKIIIRFFIGTILYESTMEFMSVDKDATSILSWEGDWINIDEGGLLDNLAEISAHVGSRLRGTVKGRERLGRFSIISNSWDNYELWRRFDMAFSQPEEFLSIVVSSKHNKNVTERQLKRMIERIPPEDRQRFIEGSRPEGRGKYFSPESIYKCEDAEGGEFIKDRVKNHSPGYRLVFQHGIGVTLMERPSNPRHMYMLLGDPGIDDAPKRNSPVLMLWDVSSFPSVPATLVAFWWGSGNRNIGPFVERMLEWMERYKPVYTGIDSTGPQKNMAFLINEYLFQRKFGTEEDERASFDSPTGVVTGIGGLDFSGAKKPAYLMAARLLLEGGLLSFPKIITGIRSQLSNYDLERDKKIPQDIVATIAMSAHAIRTYFHIDPKELLATVDQVEAKPTLETGRNARRSSRTRRSEHARPQATPLYS